MKQSIQLAVNGTLMRGLKLNHNLMNIGATFIREDHTDEFYRLWSINDDHPGMIRFQENGNSIALEIWDVPAEGLASLLMSEPSGLCIGKIYLKDKTIILGVLAEPWLVDGKKEITQHGGWRQYTATIS